MSGGVVASPADPFSRTFSRHASSIGVFAEKPLYFLHIPKTAGTTLISVLDLYYPQQEICPARLWHEIIQIPRQDLTKYRLFRGHFYYALSKYLQRDLIHITLLRDPIERTISHFEHIRRESGHYLHKKVLTQDLAAFATDPETRPMIENFQTRALAMDFDPQLLAQGMTESELAMLTLERTIESFIPDVPDHEMLARAKLRLSQFAFVGLVEQFDQSVRRMCDILGWLPPGDYTPLNASAHKLRRDEVPAETLGLISDLTRLDAELYRQAEAILFAQAPLNTRKGEMTADRVAPDQGRFISYAQNCEDVMLYRALKHVERGFYIDVGAQDPVVDSVTKAFYERGWRGINIEPVRTYYDKLVGDRAEDINLMVAAGERGGDVAFFEVPDTGLSTTNRLYSERYANEGRSVKEYFVSCLPLSAICTTYQVKEVHFLKIDVEGAEKAVLAGFDFSMVRPWIVLIEATDPSSQEPIYSDWEPLLLQQGYEFAYFDGLNRFYVAREKSELKSAFNTPPNIFDLFVRHSEWESRQHVKRSSQEVQELHAQLQAERDQMAQALQAHLAERDQIAQPLQAQLAEREQQTKALQAQLAEREQQTKALQAQLAEREQQTQALQAQLAEREQQTQALQAQLAEREQQTQALQAQLAQREQDLAEIRSSKSWKLALLFRRARVVLAPPNSHRARVLRAIVGAAFLPFVQARRNRRIETDLALIRSSGLFDETWYLAKNPEVAAPRTDPARHYLLVGGSEGRDPSPYFSSSRYLDSYRDVRISGANPLVHYLRYGKAEGRVAGTNRAVQALASPELSARVEGVLAQPREPREHLRHHPGARRESQLDSTVSIVVPAFNGSKTIRGTLEGVLRQTYRDYEVVVVDDGSTDSTADMVREMIPSATIIEQSNKGTMDARQAGIDAAKGEFIALLDQDDAWSPEMLETEVAILRQRPEIGLVLANMKAVNEDGRDLGFNVVPPDKCYSPSWEELLLLHPVAASTALFRTDLAARIGGLDSRFRFSGALGDSDTFVRLSEVAGIHFLDRCLGDYFWSEYRPGRLVSFLDNLEVYARKYMSHPRLSGTAGTDLRARFAHSCSGYSLHICRMLASQEGGNLPRDMKLKVERHQANMRRLFGAFYKLDVLSPIPTARPDQPHNRLLAPLTELAGTLLPVGSRRRRVSAPFLRVGRILIAEGAASLGRKTLDHLRTRRREQQSEEQSPSATLTRKMMSSKKTKVLVIDDYIPAIRYGSGFPRLYKMLSCLTDLGYLTTFFPVGNPVKVQPETSELQRKGIEVFWGSQLGLEEFAQSRTGYYDVVLVSRPHVFERILPYVVQWWPKAAVLYDAEALFYARDIVEAEIAGAVMQESDKARRARKEMQLIEKADVVISVSQKTKDIMLENSSQRNIQVWEHIQDVPGSKVPFGQREGLVHFGSFFAGAGSPNEDAVLYFVGEVLPEIRRTLSCKLYIVGTSPTPAVMNLATQDVEVVGYVDTPKTYFDMCRVNVVPTRVFATGIPLKLIEAMSCGIPSVVNGRIARHLGLVDGNEVLVADSTKEFATKVVQLYSDGSLWQRLHRNSISYVTDNYSYEKMRQRLDAAIRKSLEISSKKA